MSEYIKREDAMKPLYERFSSAKSRGDDGIAEIVGMDYIAVSNVPSADVVEVVRCKECMHNGSFDTDCPFGWRDERFNLPDDIDFCSYGEREEQEHE